MEDFEFEQFKGKIVDRMLEQFEVHLEELGKALLCDKYGVPTEGMKVDEVAYWSKKVLYYTEIGVDLTDGAVLNLPAPPDDWKPKKFPVFKPELSDEKLEEIKKKIQETRPIVIDEQPDIDFIDEEGVYSISKDEIKGLRDNMIQHGFLEPDDEQEVYDYFYADDDETQFVKCDECTSEYCKCDDFNYLFGEVLEELPNGKTWARDEWFVDGKPSQYIKLSLIKLDERSTHQLLIFKDGFAEKYIPSDNDLFAEDWKYIEDDTEEKK